MEILQRGIQIQQVTTVSRNIEISKSPQTLKIEVDYKGPMNKLVPESLSNHKEIVMAETNYLSTEYRGLDISKETFKYEFDPNAFEPNDTLAQATSPELNVKAFDIFPNFK